MKVAYFTYPSAFQNVGGGEILLLKLREFVQKEGVTADLFDTWRARIEDYDILHVFGSVKDCLGLVRVANSRGVKVAISPLIWSDGRHALFSAASPPAKALFLARHILKVAWPTFPSARRELLQRADLIFPNSEIERRHYARLFAVPEHKMDVVYNAVDPHFLDADPQAFASRHGQGFILGVGRIEPRKNQLNLIRAVKGIPGARLVLIGSPVSGYERYFRQCQNEGSGCAVFLPTLAHEDPLLRSAYAACGLFVLQGWFETPGLAALEAVLAGAPVVVTRGGSTREYFQNHVDYIDPASPSDIRQKIRSKLGSKKNTDALKRHVLENFTWEKTAKRTVEGYRRLVDAGSQGSFSARQNARRALK